MNHNDLPPGWPLAITIGLFVGYFLPSLIALLRRHPNGCAILVVNLSLGWTLLGWVVALAWSCTGQDRPRNQ